MATTAVVIRLEKSAHPVNAPSLLPETSDRLSITADHCFFDFQIGYAQAPDKEETWPAS